MIFTMKLCLLKISDSFLPFTFSGKLSANELGEYNRFVLVVVLLAFWDMHALNSED